VLDGVPVVTVREIRPVGPNVFTAVTAPAALSSQTGVTPS
jgi:hypothetical protein